MRTKKLLLWIRMSLSLHAFNSEGLKISSIPQRQNPSAKIRVHSTRIFLPEEPNTKVHVTSMHQSPRDLDSPRSPCGPNSHSLLLFDPDCKENKIPSGSQAFSPLCLLWRVQPVTQAGLPSLVQPSEAAEQGLTAMSLTGCSSSRN